MKPYYDEDGITIYPGDCREIFGSVAADVLVTDPPYGIGLSSGWAGGFGDLRVAGDHDVGWRDEILRMISIAESANSPRAILTV